MFITLVVIIVLIIIWIVKTYNKLQSDMQSIREQLSNLQAALKKRVDLANQIVDIAKGYGEHEKIAHLSVSNSNKAMSSMKALSQSFPDLKANQTYQTLMTQLEGLEDTILQRRERYNAKVKNYNSYRNAVPAIFIANKLSFSTAPYYELEDPDFMEKIKLFERDDSEALQKLIQNGGSSVGNSIQHSKTKLQEHLKDIPKPHANTSGEITPVDSQNSHDNQSANVDDAVFNDKSADTNLSNTNTTKPSE